MYRPEPLLEIKKWPNINKMGTRPSDSDEWKDVKGKFEKHFSPNPGKGS